MPEEHDGTNDIVFNLVFSEEVFEGSESLDKNQAVRNALSVTGGTARASSRVVKDSYDAWEIKVRPSGIGPVSIALNPPGGECTASTVACTPDGRKLKKAAIARRVEGPATLTVTDARVEEGPEALLEFGVKLSRAASDTVTVDYATSDRTGTAGTDYRATSGTLTFAPGVTKKTIGVPVIDDSHDDDAETLTLTLSNASGAYILDGEATGTIDNTDPMPRAWLARFGRAVSVQAADAIRGRLSGADRRVRDNHFTVGGRRVDTLFGALRSAAGDGGRKDETKDARLEPESAWARMDRMKAEAMGWSAANGGDGLVNGGMPRGLRSADSGPAGSGPGSAGGVAQRRGASSNDRASAGLEQLLSAALPSAVRPLAEVLDAGRRDWRGLLLGSSFDYSRAFGDGTANGLSGWSAWGRAAESRFRGAEGPLSIDGQVATATVGADAQWGRWLAGVAVSSSWGEGVYRHATASGGEVTSRPHRRQPVRALRRQRARQPVGHGRLRRGRAESSERARRKRHRDGP